jgi:hypothetical protein
MISNAGVAIAAQPAMAPGTPATKYPTATMWSPTGPGVLRVMTTASFNCWSVSTWCWKTSDSWITGNEARPANAVTVPLSKIK